MPPSKRSPVWLHDRVAAPTGAMHLAGALHLTSVCLSRLPVTTDQHAGANGVVFAGYIKLSSVPLDSPLSKVSTSSCTTSLRTNCGNRGGDPARSPCNGCYVRLQDLMFAFLVVGRQLTIDQREIKFNRMHRQQPDIVWVAWPPVARS